MAATVEMSACASASAGRLAAMLSAATIALMLSGCGDTLNNGVFDRFATAPPVPMPARAAESVPTASAMHGRWVLTMPGTGACALTFGTAAAESAIAPEDGCPKPFTASHSWTIEPNGVVIRDPRGAPLAALRMTEPGRLEGVTPNGEQVLLAR
jgi:hypothetical protein